MKENNLLLDRNCSKSSNMYLAINIQELAQPVVNDTKRVPWVLKFLYFLKGRLVTRYNKHLTTFYVALEGAINHVDEVSVEKSRTILEETKDIIVSVENAAAYLAKSNYLDSEEVKKNIQYTLNCLYIFESKLHVQVYKSAPIVPIDQDLKEGISRMNKTNFNELLSN